MTININGSKCPPLSDTEPGKLRLVVEPGTIRIQETSSEDIVGQLDQMERRILRTLRHKVDWQPAQGPRVEGQIARWQLIAAIELAFHLAEQPFGN